MPPVAWLPSSRGSVRRGHAHPPVNRCVPCPGRGWRPGDVVWCPPGVKHWRGAAPTTAMTHLAVTATVEERTFPGWRKSAMTNTTPASRHGPSPLRSCQGNVRMVLNSQGNAYRRGGVLDGSTPNKNVWFAKNVGLPLQVFWRMKRRSREEVRRASIELTERIGGILGRRMDFRGLFSGFRAALIHRSSQHLPARRSEPRTCSA